ncbi:class I SAM-dependent methyltransferase [Kibdelosporangium lantanae]|uniref:Class I SAM-dependent methyltransferase n=1 Tax=Kibdelosporangium lantanae TaxID=1497396 RepID=A0ABW3M5L3_9PSEU
MRGGVVLAFLRITGQAVPLSGCATDEGEAVSMIAELLARSGNTLLAGVAPDGKDYWARRFWDRDSAEAHPNLGDHFLAQKSLLADLIGEFGAGATDVLEFCCGTGELTRITAGLPSVRTITAVDISAQALEHARERVDHDGLRLIEGDFWADNGLAPTELVLCVDAIHHLGDMPDVLRRLRSFVRPGGVLVGNIWTADNFHEFERIRYGRMSHLRRTAAFLGAAALIRLSGGRLKAGAYRTQLRRGVDAERLLRNIFGEPLAIQHQRYFTGFVVRRS